MTLAHRLTAAAALSAALLVPPLTAQPAVLVGGPTVLTTPPELAGDAWRFEDPVIAPLAGGGAVLVWRREAAFRTGFVELVELDPLGLPTSAPWLASSSSSGRELISVATLGSDEAAVAGWTAASEAVVLRLDLAAQRRTATAEIDSFPSAPGPTAIALGPDGSGLALWADRTGGVSIELRARALSADGRGAGEPETVFKALSFRQVQLLPVPAPAAGEVAFLAAWEHDVREGSATVRRIAVAPLAADGRPLRPPVVLAPSRARDHFGAPRLLPGRDGGFRLFGYQHPERRLWVQEIAADGTLSPERRTVVEDSGVVATLAGAADAEGTVVLSWQTGDRGLLAVALDAGGSVVAGPFPVRPPLADGLAEPAVGALAPGRFLVAWTDGSLAGQLVEVDPDAVARPEPAPSAPLTEEEVACTRRRLAAFLERTRAVGPAAEHGVALSPAAHGALAGLAWARAASGDEVGRLVFTADPGGTPLLANPARPPLPTLTLARYDAASKLAEGPEEVGALTVRFTPTLEPDPAAEIAIDNLSGDERATRADSAPGRGLLPLVTPCHEPVVARDRHVLALLRRLARPDVPGAGSSAAMAIQRAPEPDSFRIEVRARGDSGEAVGLLVGHLRVFYGPGNRLWVGELKLAPPCDPDEPAVDCSAAPAGSVLRLVPALPGASPPDLAVEAALDGQPIVFDFSTLLAGSTWEVLP